MARGVKLRVFAAAGQNMKKQQEDKNERIKSCQP
jgi:hypothetical protein